MLTGRRAFAGDDVSDTLAAVLRGEPAWDALPNDVPEAIRSLLRGCLEKDRQKRVSDIAVARFVMADTGGLRAPATATKDRPRRPSRVRTIAGMAAIVVAAVAATAAGAWLLLRPTVAPRPMRFAIVPSPAQPLATQGTDRDIAIAPDGAFFVYRTVVGGVSQLAVRAFDELDAKLLAGTGSAIGAVRSPFVSADGQWIGFQDAATLRKIAVNGGLPVTLCPITGALRGATWGEDDTIVFATADVSAGLLSVAAGGGEPKVLTKADASRGELDHLFPSLLPGGRAVLFAVVTAPGLDGAQVAVLDLETGEQRVLIRGANYPQYLNTGHLLYAAAGGGLRAVRFDSSNLQVLGDPVPVLDQVFVATSGVANAAVSRQGTLVYVPGTGPVGALTIAKTLAWVDRQGNESPLKAPPRAFANPRLSPDGRQVAVEINDATQDVWIFDLGRESLTRQTFESLEDETPSWAPDGRWIAYSSSRGTDRTVFRRRADGSGPEEALWTARNHSHVEGWLSDGRALLVVAADSLGTQDDVVLLPVEGDRTPKPLLRTRFTERGATVSPDGRWLAYSSDESGREQVYVQPFPSLAVKWQVSVAGGSQPVWSRKGNELFYRGEGAFMAVRILLGEVFSAGPPEKLFEDRYYNKGVGHTGYDVAADGRFLVVKDVAASRQTETGTPASLVVVLNWFEELKARVPAR